MNSEQLGRLVMIALDAAEPRLVEKWMDDGSLPNLARLRARGCYGRLASSSDWLAGSPWPTFYTGTTPADHGVYHFLQWQADRMTYARPGPDWLRARPFWRDLSSSGCRAIAIDLPMTFAPEPFNGLEISGWATHDLLSPPASYPEEEMDAVRRQFGPSPIHEEAGGLQRPKALLSLRDELIRATHLVAELAVSRMNREPWDLFLTGFGAPHRGGHRLWDLSGVRGPVGREEERQLGAALQDVYAACDAAVGRLVAEAGEHARIVVFSLHGMGANTDRSHLTAGMLSRILDERTQSRPAKQTGLLERMREFVPLELRNRVKRMLPSVLQDRLTLFWRVNNTDWGKVSAFGLISDLQGYIRINLRHREAAGIVEPGEEYDRLCDRIAEGLKTFRDADTGEPLVDSVLRVDELYPHGSRRNNLPDLLVRWAHSPAANHRALVSDRYGTIEWPTPGLNPDGRSGNHRPQGFLVVAGERIAPASHVEGAHIMDLAPTAYALLGVAQPPEMRGKVLSVIRAMNP